MFTTRVVWVGFGFCLLGLPYLLCFGLRFMLIDGDVGSGPRALGSSFNLLLKLWSGWLCLWKSWSVGGFKVALNSALGQTLG